MVSKAKAVRFGPSHGSSARSHAREPPARANPKKGTALPSARGCITLRVARAESICRAHTRIVRPAAPLAAPDPQAATHHTAPRCPFSTASQLRAGPRISRAGEAQLGKSKTEAADGYPQGDRLDSEVPTLDSPPGPVIRLV